MTIIKIEISGFEKPIEIVSSFGNWGLISELFDTSLHERLKLIVIKRNHRSDSGFRA